MVILKKQSLGDDNMDYCKEKKSDWNAKLIYAGDDFLKTTENLPVIEGAKWIWPLFTTRGFLRRDFFVDGNVFTANSYFVCDNGFDVYVNGTLVQENVKIFSEDISSYLKTGENMLAFRVFATDDDMHFTSAICGAVNIKTDLAEYRIVTDNSFHNFHPEFSNNEPAGWLTEKGLKEAYLVCEDIHPRLTRRSLYMRKDFVCGGEISSASLAVFSEGEAELYINGKKISEEFLSQGIMERYSEYRVYDVKDYLNEGENVISAITGNGWLNSESHNVMYAHKNALLAELNITYQNGENSRVVTDKSWRIFPSPIIENDLQFGERYDARLEQNGFSCVGFDDSAWGYAEERSADRGREYVKRNYPPVLVKKLLAPVSVTEYEGGILFDFGYNCAGKYVLNLKNTKAGQKIKLSVCEMLKSNGSMQLSCYAPVCNSDDFYKSDGRAKSAIKNYDVYICKGGETESYMPRFSFNGFRYIKIEGAEACQIESLELAVMHNDVNFGWKIESSDPFYKTFAEITERTMKGNMINGFVDCPTREKNYWTGDIAVFVQTACYMADVDSLLARWTDGGRKLGTHEYGWGDEVYIIPLMLYRFYGNKSVLTECYDNILNFTYKRVSAVDGGLPDGSDSPYNDHLNPFNKNLSGDYFSSCFYCYNLKCVSEIARIVGDFVNYKKLLSFYNNAVERFNDKYFIRSESDYTPHSQSGLVLSLAFSLVPEDCKEAVADRLNKYVVEQGSLTTGYVATRYLMQVLCDYGYTDTAYMLLSRNDFPSWRNLIENATTITEHWDGMEPSGCSKNHFALGSLCGWMFEYLGGIRSEESLPGFEEVCLKPVFIREIGDFSCEYTSRKGAIKTEWRVLKDTVLYSFTSPVPVRLCLQSGEDKRYPSGSHSIEISI